MFWKNPFLNIFFHEGISFCILAKMKNSQLACIMHLIIAGLNTTISMSTPEVLLFDFCKLLILFYIYYASKN